MPADVFQALEDTEFAFLRAPLEAEFASAYPFPLLYPLSSRPICISPWGEAHNVTSSSHLQPLASKIQPL